MQGKVNSSLEQLQGDDSLREISDESQRLLNKYRHSYDYEAHVKGQRSSSHRIKRPFETLEIAFQVTCQVMVALFAPRVHPIMHWLSCVLPLRRPCPRVLPTPALSVLVSGLHAKLVLDVANHLWLPPFRWVDHRPAPDEMLHPFTFLGLELNLLGAISGVSVGRTAVVVRQAMWWLAMTALSALPVRTSTWLQPRVQAIAPLAAVLWHLTTCFELAPAIVSALGTSLYEAQMQNDYLVPTVTRSLLAHARRALRSQLVSLGLVKLEKVEEDPLELPCWDCGDEDDLIPHDLLCPITGHLFVRPVALHGSVFEENAVRRWVRATGRHPILQGIACRLSDIKATKDVQDLCHKLAASRGWVLCSVSTATK